MSIEAETDVDLAPLLNGSQTVPSWICGQLKALPPLTLQSETSVIMAWSASFDSILWQLQQAELKRSVEFETCSNRLAAQLPNLQSKLRELRAGHRGDCSLRHLDEQMTRIEGEAEILQSLLNDQKIERLKHLRSEKSRLENVLRLAQLEKRWRDDVAAMAIATERADIDEAQELLEKLDSAYELDWNGAEQKKAQLDGLRHQLVQQIRNL